MSLCAILTFSMTSFELLSFINGVWPLNQRYLGRGTPSARHSNLRVCPTITGVDTGCFTILTSSENTPFDCACIYTLSTYPYVLKLPENHRAVVFSIDRLARRTSLLCYSCPVAGSIPGYRSVSRRSARSSRPSPSCSPFHVPVPSSKLFSRP